jgi:hypothetical protein
MTPEDPLAAFLDRYTPEIGARAAAVVERLRARLPGAVALVYDNFNALVVAFGPSERASEAILSVAVYPRWVSLFLADGASLPDPEGVLQGSGKRFRHVVLAGPDDLDRPALAALIDVALARARVPLDPSAPSRLVVRSVSAKQRPRRPG